MFGDELFDIGEFADFGNAEDVIEVADFGGGEELIDFADIDANWADDGYTSFAASGAEGTQMFGDELSYDTGNPFELGADEWAAQDAAYWETEPTFSWDQSTAGQYATPIGPGLNGTPGYSPVSQADGGLFGGVKSALGAIFNGNPNTAMQRQNSTVYGRQTLVRNANGVYARPAGTSQNSLSAMLARLTGGGTTASRGGLFGTSGGDNTAMFIMAGVALLGVALLAKR